MTRTPPPPPVAPLLSPTLRVLIGLAAAVIALAGVAYAHEVIGPLALAIVFVVICEPVRRPLERRGWPRWAGTTAVIVLAYVPAIARSGPRPRLDIPGTILVSGALFGLVYGFSNAETDGWDSPLTWGMLAASVVLLVAFVLWQRRAAHPLLPLAIVLDRNRGAAYLSVLIAGASMFGIFLFVTYYLQLTLGYSPIQTGLSFLPMIGMLVLAAQLGTNIFVPRFGPKVLVPAGMTLGVIGMIWLTFLDASSTYAANVMPPLMVIGFAMGTIMPASMQTATLGVDRQFAGARGRGAGGHRQLCHGVRVGCGVLRGRRGHVGVAVPPSRPGALAGPHAGR